MSERSRVRLLALSVIVGTLVLSQLVAASARPMSVDVRGPRVAGASAGGVDPVIAAAGDIACDPTASGYNGGLGSGKKCMQKATSDLLVAGAFDAVLALGDEQYECAGDSAFAASYGPSWGRVANITYPAIGNHEYQTSGGSGCNPVPGGGYENYFTAAGAPQLLGPNNAYYYSFDLGSWHLIALNANCSTVACKDGSTQETWLERSGSPCELVRARLLAPAEIRFGQREAGEQQIRRGALERPGAAHADLSSTATATITSGSPGWTRAELPARPASGSSSWGPGGSRAPAISTRTGRRRRSSTSPTTASWS